jgi:hypothetical protein
MATDFKGTSEHAAQHQHGVRYAGEPPAPKTVEQRVSAIETLIEADGKSIDEQLAELKERNAPSEFTHDGARIEPQTEQEEAKPETKAEAKERKREERAEARAEAKE